MYTRFLPCTPIFDGRHIVITVKVPLAEYSHKFDIFRAYSLPVPLLDRTKGKPRARELLAYYKLESNYLAINSERTQYILMNENEVQLCKESGMQICNIKSPIRNSNVGQNCVMSNFNQDKQKVKQHCNAWIHRTVLPTAFYLENEVYLVVTNKQIVFHLSCKNKESNIEPPFGFLTLHNTCQATFDHFSLMGYFENKTRQEMSNPADGILKGYNISDSNVWDDINDVIPFHNDTLKIPTQLENLEDFPLGDLMNGLDETQTMVPMKVEHSSVWNIVVIVMVALYVLLLLSFCVYRRLRHNILANLSCTIRRSKLTTNQVLTVTKSDSGEIVCSAPKEFHIEATEPFIESTSRHIIGRKVDVLDTK